MTQPIRDYRDLRVWHLAIELDALSATVTGTLPGREWRLSSQIGRAASSVHANIAEGNGSFSTRDYIRHIGIAHKSLRELESHLHSVRRRYPRITIVGEALTLCDQVRILLGGLRRSLVRKLQQE